MNAQHRLHRPPPYLLLPFLSGCTSLDSPGGRIGLLVLVPLLFIGLFLWALRVQRLRPRKEKDVDRRRFPDYDDRE